MRFQKRNRVGLVLLLGALAISGILWLSGHGLIDVQSGGTAGAGWQAVMITWPAPVLLLVALVGLLLLLWPRGSRRRDTQAFK